MSETSFTPGPWAARIEYKKSMLSKHTYTMCSIHADDKCIADVVYVIHDNVDEAIANTRLIAAAPEMYEFGETTAEVLQILLERLGPNPAGFNAEIKRLAEERIAEWREIKKKASGEE